MKLNFKEKTISLFDFYIEFLTIGFKIKLTPKETQIISYLMVLQSKGKDFDKSARFELESLVTGKPVNEISQTSIVNNLLCTSLTTKRINGEDLIFKSKKNYILHSKLREVIEKTKSQKTIEISFTYDISE